MKSYDLQITFCKCVFGFYVGDKGKYEDENVTFSYLFAMLRFHPWSFLYQHVPDNPKLSIFRP